MPMPRLRTTRWLAALALASAPLAPAVACAQPHTDTLHVAPATVRAWQLGLARPDRLEHGSLSFTLAAGAGLAGANRRSAFLLSLGLGAVKELHDGRHGAFDAVDLTADAIGAALGALAAARR